MKSLLLLIILFSVCFAQIDTVIIALDEWQPFRISSEGAVPFKGIDIDIWNEISQRMNIPIKIIKYPWARALKSMENGSIDAMSGLAKTEERALYIYFIPQHYYSVSSAFYTIKGLGNSIREYIDLYKYNIGYVLNSAYFEPFNSDTLLSKIGVSTELQLLKMTELKRIKVFIGTDPQVDFDIKDMELSDYIEKAKYRPGNDLHLYFGISKKSIFLNKKEELNGTLKAMIDEGFIDAVVKQYL